MKNWLILRSFHLSPCFYVTTWLFFCLYVTNIRSFLLIPWHSYYNLNIKMSRVKTLPDANTSEPSRLLSHHLVCATEPLLTATDSWVRCQWSITDKSLHTLLPPPKGGKGSDQSGEAETLQTSSSAVSHSARISFTRTTMWKWSVSKPLFLFIHCHLETLENLQSIFLSLSLSQAVLKWQPSCQGPHINRKNRDYMNQLLGQSFSLFEGRFEFQVWPKS